MMSVKNISFPLIAAFFIPLSQLLEKVLHDGRVGRQHGWKLQAFDHVLCPLFVFLEMICFQVLLVCFVRGIDFKNAVWVESSALCIGNRQTVLISV